MESRRRVLLLTLLNRRRKNKLKKKHAQNRQYWVHPLLQARYVDGAFYTLFEKLLDHEERFFNYFRMSPATFNFLVHRLTDFIRSADTTMRLSVPPTEMLAVTLRYLASGNTFTDLHYSYRLGISTISEIVRLVCQQIWQNLKEEYLGQPSQQQWLNIAAKFQSMSHFPHCIGAVDGKHIRVQKFRHSGSMNLNYKQYFSIVLMAISDAAYKFIYVDIGAYGKDCDSSIFQQTVFWKKMQNGSLNIPGPAPLQQNTVLPFVLVGDEAFALHKNLLRPFGGHNLNVTKRIFNYRLTRARRFVECAFGILANKWRILHRALNVSKELAKDIVKATVILHNLVRERDGLRPSDMYVGMNTQGLQNISQSTNIRGGKHANDIRDDFANYFMSSTGSLPWQMAKI